MVVMLGGRYDEVVVMLGGLGLRVHGGCGFIPVFPLVL